MRPRSLSSKPLAAILAILAGATAAQAQVRQRTDDGSPLFWPASQRPVSFATSGEVLPQGMTRDRYEGAVRRAFRAWQDAPASELSFLEDRSRLAQSRSDFLSDGIHLVLVDPDNSSGLFSDPSVIAITPVEFDASGAITDADILINDRDFDFSDDLSAGTYDLQSVVAHEVGHFIGLDNSPVLGATMSPFRRPEDSLKRALSPYDLASIAAAYPRAGLSTGSLRGRIVRLLGAGVPGAKVVAHFSDGRVASATLTDADGRWVLNQLDTSELYFVTVEALSGAVNVADLASVELAEIAVDFGARAYGGPLLDTGFLPLLGGLDLGELAVDPLPQLGGVVVTDIGGGLTFQQGETRRVTLNFEGTLSLSDTVLASSSDLSITNVDIQPLVGAQVSFDLSVASNARPGSYSLFVRRLVDGALSPIVGAVEVVGAAPSLAQVSPEVARFGTTITISGQNFTADTRVAVGGELLENFSVISDQQINLTLPREGDLEGLVEGLQTLSVENADGQGATLTAAFTMSASPEIPARELPESAPQAPAFGGGGGGGCDLAPGSPADPRGALPLLLVLLALAALRRR